MKPKCADPLDGVKSFSIGGRMVHERQRCLGMTDEERRWRAQWLKDQVLSPTEPRNVRELYKDTTNIFRRLYKTPMYWLYEALKTRMSPETAFLARHIIGKTILGLSLTYVVYYNVKYKSSDFTQSQKLEFFQTRPTMFPDDPDYPNYPKKEPHEYYDLGFYSSVLCQTPEPLEPPPPPPPSLPPPLDEAHPEVVVTCVPQE